MEWKEFESYKISNRGDVIGKKGRLLFGSISNKGYKRVYINKKHYTVHSLVAMLFIGERPDGFVIDHIDRDKLNNNVSNLRYITNQQNQFNKNSKGYYVHKNGFQAQIMLNGKYYTKQFKTKEEARNWYLEKKAILHII